VRGCLRSRRYGKASNRLLRKHLPPNNMKIATIVGARPQFVKTAVVSRALRSRPGGKEVLIHTGQHYDVEMSDSFFRELMIPAPAYNLGVGSGNHGQQTGEMLCGIEQILLKEQPDCVLVYGDTNSTLAGALAAVKLHIAIAHVEAGLRSYNRMMPEEINRTLTDHCSDLLFAPTAIAVENLRREDLRRGVHNVGDVMYEAFLQNSAAACRRDVLESLNLAAGAYALVTIHRAENTDSPERLSTIMDALARLSDELLVIFILHPRTRAVLSKLPPRKATPRLRLIPAVGYLDLMSLEHHARVIVTDSGGIQKEAYFHRVPCVTLRSETEWTELVAAGWNRVTPPTNVQRILQAIGSALNSRPSNDDHLFGDGSASSRIADILLAHHAPSRTSIHDSAA
jgi:UDP-GlcNAc3NAcA epimerase